VIAGNRRGRHLGVPTANLRVPPEKLVPGRGVYAAYAILEGESYPAAVNVGVRPTFGQGVLSVEAHLLDADLDLYGRSLTVAFVHRLRDERRFPSIDALRVQLGVDIEAARAALGEVRKYSDRA
jgi:riboflavin kinase/FMN adenylyltransferase